MYSCIKKKKLFLKFNFRSFNIKASFFEIKLTICLQLNYKANKLAFNLLKMILYDIDFLLNISQLKFVYLKKNELINPNPNPNYFG
jgi:hypothetical protein